MAIEADAGGDEDVHPSLPMIMLSLRCPDAVPLLRPLPLSLSSSSPEGTDFEVFD